MAQHVSQNKKLPKAKVRNNVESKEIYEHLEVLKYNWEVFQ